MAREHVVSRGPRQGYARVAMASDFEQLERGATTVYGSSAGIWTMIIFARPTADDMRLARPALAAMRKRRPRGFPTITWILPQAGLSMDDDARKAASDVTKEFDGTIVAQATLIELEGFQGATVRAIVAGLDMVSRSSAPKKTFAALAPTIAWCLPFTGETSTSVEAVRVALESMRASVVGATAKDPRG